MLCVETNCAHKYTHMHERAHTHAHMAWVFLSFSRSQQRDGYTLIAMRRFEIEWNIHCTRSKREAMLYSRCGISMLRTLYNCGIDNTDTKRSKQMDLMRYKAKRQTWIQCTAYKRYTLNGLEASHLAHLCKRRMWSGCVLRPNRAPHRYDSLAPIHSIQPTFEWNDKRGMAWDVAWAIILGAFFLFPSLSNRMYMLGYSCMCRLNSFASIWLFWFYSIQPYVCYFSASCIYGYIFTSCLYVSCSSDEVHR